MDSSRRRRLNSQPRIIAHVHTQRISRKMQARPASSQNHMKKQGAAELKAIDRSMSR
jgi:hypothetical protein